MRGAGGGGATGLVGAAGGAAAETVGGAGVKGELPDGDGAEAGGAIVAAERGVDTGEAAAGAGATGCGLGRAVTTGAGVEGTVGA